MSTPHPSVLVFSEVFPPRHGGSGRWLWELYRRLEGFDVRVLAGEAPGDTDFDRAAPFPIARFPAPFRSWGVLGVADARAFWRSVRQVRALALEHRSGVIHAGKCLPEGLVAIAAARRGGLPVWCYAHGEELTLAHTSRELTWLTRFVLGRASRVVANSRHTAQLLSGDWDVPADRVVVLTPGVDTSRFVPAESDRARRGKLGWQGRRVILTVGTLQARKGQDMLIRALPAIRVACPDVLYAVAGVGRERERLEGLVEELDVAAAVQFLGAPADADLAGLYQECDVFALPNRQVGWDFEGFGIVLLEAQACGRPVIAGASGGTAETLVPGVTGELVDCETPEPLQDACVALLSDPARRARMGQSAREWVVQHFDWNGQAREASILFGG